MNSSVDRESHRIRRRDSRARLDSMVRWVNHSKDLMVYMSRGRGLVRTGQSRRQNVTFKRES